MIKPILHTKKGERVSIHCFGCSQDQCGQLQQLGCLEGSRGKILSNNKRVIIEIGGTRLGIGSKLAETILVSSL
ncbi:FeoA domain-containing protein [Gracilimonas mengyeensis]|uniref:FeoA family protein n=1 Tax=Gracilimonas mengyeensis TaxID=1302730 RepID=UPI00115B4EE0